MDMRATADFYEAALLSADPVIPTLREQAGAYVAALPDERTLQLLLLEGSLGTEFTDDSGRQVSIISFGDWNRGAGPDFLNACISIDGRRIHGDIELDPTPEDWEHHGHGANPNFNDVALHLTCVPCSKGWFTRNSRHERIPCACIPDHLLSAVAPMPAPLAPARPCQCAEQLAGQTPERVESVLLAAAAYRFRAKSSRFMLRAAFVGREQALYEALAETLGYHANKNAMRHLAMRAPLKAIKAAPEAILFGTAGFLLPVLPDTSTPHAVAHHKQLWEQWWPERERFELSAGRVFPWSLSGSRPANHPQRRVGALSVIAARFSTFVKLCEPDKITALEEFLSGLRHPYWSTHVTLPSKPSARPMALMGRDRIGDFIINHVLPARGTDEAWSRYLERKAPRPGSKILSAHASILGAREDAPHFLKKAWHQQALLQIKADLCSRHVCPACELLKRLA